MVCDKNEVNWKNTVCLEYDTNLLFAVRAKTNAKNELFMVRVHVLQYVFE